MNNKESGQKEKIKRKDKKAKSSVAKKVLLIVFLVCGLTIIVGSGVVLGTVYVWIKDAEPMDYDELFDLNQTTYIVDVNEKVIDKLHANENRTMTTLDEIPKDLQNAFIAIEDKRFYTHNGVDIKRIIGSAIEDFKLGKLAHGGSTITQQLIKNIYLKPEKKFKRKIIEAYYAIQLERQFTKNQILEAYLNTIGLGGNNVAGVKEAALYYFAKDIGDLNLAESAIIAGITKYPSTYSPYLNFDSSIKRKNLIISEMLDQNMISKEEYDEALDAEIKLAKVEREIDTTYFADMVIKDVIFALQEKLGYTKEEANRKVYNGGLKIVATIDTDMQNIVENAFENEKLFPPSKEDEEGTLQPEASFVIIDNNTGEIKAIMGGRSTKIRRGLNRATQSLRQPGSSIKPLSVYAPALDNGYTAGTVVDDSPVTFGNYSPRNYDKTFRGLVSIREGIRQSLNIVAVRVLQDIGVERSVEYLQKFGLTTVETKNPKRNDRNLPALALGGMTNGAKPVEMVAAYNVFPNKGVYISPKSFTKVYDRHGNILIENAFEKRRVINEQVAYLMVNMMRDVVQSGTGVNASLPNMPVGGKTGTTTEYKDAWFIGYTPYYTAAVWMGHDDPKPMSFTGGSYPARLWKAIMADIHKGLPAKKFEQPGGFVTVEICTKSGKRPTELCKLDPRGPTIKSEIFIKGTEPDEENTCDIHVIKDICTESGLLASPSCPPSLIESKIFTQRTEPLDKNKALPADSIYEAPDEICDLQHEYFDEEEDNDDNENNFEPENNKDYDKDNDNNKPKKESNSSDEKKENKN
ncbi:MAG: PBP1A family penicillin-binding protein [Clostridiales bacterium]|nr:PBP1A family penicillin-binding protein [Clostridiales bacterium]